MSKILTVDIKARFLRDDQRCYILFPGTGYRYYAEMAAGSEIYLDVPGFPHDPKEDLSGAKDLAKRIAVSDRIKDWHDDGQPADKLPARSVKELKNFRTTTGRDQFAGLLRNFFSTIKRGDIVIVPSKNQEDDVLFGEVMDDGLSCSVEVARYPKEPIPARKIRWTRRVPRSDIPGWLERKIGSPNPLRQIENKYFYDIFDIMFERYYYQGQFFCKFNVASKDFSTLDNFLFQQIVLYVASLHEAKAEGNIKDIARKSIAVVASQIDFSEDIPDQRISINSPGHIVVYAKNIIPLIAGVMMALSAAAGGEDIRGADIEILNSLDDGQVSRECISDIQSEVSEDIDVMGYARWQELCTIEMQARKRTKIRSGMKVDATGPAAKTDRLDRARD